jgi:hypothetical protein
MSETSKLRKVCASRGLEQVKGFQEKVKDFEKDEVSRSQVLFRNIKGLSTEGGSRRGLIVEVA